MKLNDLISIMLCPSCGSDLTIIELDTLECTSCLKPVNRFKEAYVFLNSQISDSIGFQRIDILDRIKSIGKNFPKIYSFLINCMSPVFWNKKSLRLFLNDDKSENLKIINIGSGSSNLGVNVLNLDFSFFPNVDVLANMNCLPIRSEAIDRVVSIAVLEHTPNPALSVAEMHRILKPGGQVFCFFPFVQGFHASPHDYSRFTSEGLKQLFSDFDIKDIEGVGITSSLLWIFQEWLSSLLSFGNQKAHYIIYVIVLSLTWPIKYLDLILVRKKIINNIPSGYVITAIKPSFESLK
jgi:SAM-dependent methyltransferase